METDVFSANMVISVLAIVLSMQLQRRYNTLEMYMPGVIHNLTATELVQV